MKRKKQIGLAVLVAAAAMISAALYRLFGVGIFAVIGLVYIVTVRIDVPDRENVVNRKPRLDFVALTILKVIAAGVLAVIGSFVLTPFLALPAVAALIFIGTRKKPIIDTRT